MCRESFRFLRQYIGEKLLNYILNTDDYIKSNISYEQLEFNTNQKKVINELYETIVEMNASKHMFGDLASHELIMLKARDGDSLFNDYRRYCGGDFPKYESDDNLLNFLVKIAIREYPNLLFKAYRITREGVMDHFFLNISECKELVQIVKNDILDTISNKKDDWEYELIINTESEMSFKYQVVGMTKQIIERSFNNSCNKMDSTIDGTIKEIEQNIRVLRELAKGNETEFSSFIGIKGLELRDIDKIEFEASCLRQLNDTLNPSTITRGIVSTYKEAGNQHISGCILEIKHKTKIKEIDEETDKHSKYLGLYIHYLLKEFSDNLNLSIIFTKKIDSAMNVTVFENGFPLADVGDFSFLFDKVCNTIVIEECDIVEIKKWVDLLEKVDIKKIHTSLERLKMAIFERRSIEDSIVDGIIAWEGIFGGKTETTFKVTSSICRYLDYSLYAENKKTFLEELVKLYGLRSAIVHGSKPRIKIDNDTRAKVIDIAIECIKKILQDEEMLNLKPEDRVKRLVYIE